MSKWSDTAFLDALRQAGDPLADAAVARLHDEGGAKAVGRAFRHLQGNATPLPADAPEALHAFMRDTGGLPPWVQPSRLEAGGAAFLKNALPSVVVLLASSLPRGYAAPCLTEILSISRNLERHPYERLMGVVQLLVDVSDHRAFLDGGRAIVTAKKLRLLHAGIRVIADQWRPGFRASYGVPVNHEDMLATIMAFSYLLVTGIRRLGLPLSDQEAEDHYYLWRVFAVLMGIHPPGAPHDDSLVPATLTEAAEFYAAYVARNNTGPECNPYGVTLTEDNLAMMEGLLPTVTRLCGLGVVPQLCMTELMSPDELARVGFAPMPGHRVLRRVLTFVLEAGQWTGHHDSMAAHLAELLLQGMVDVARRGEVEFSVPLDRLDLQGSAFI